MENNNEGIISNSENLLQEESAYLVQYEYAGVGQRFLNCLIDNLLMRFGLSYVSGIAIGTLIAVISPDFLSDLDPNNMSFKYFGLAYLIGIVNYLFYYTICEKLFKGYTLGKIITGTRAIREDGTELRFKDALLRSLCRLVPFEIFSGFQIRPWHDQWTDTMVIKSR